MEKREGGREGVGVSVAEVWSSDLILGCESTWIE
jgi:hypothetical protein